MYRTKHNHAITPNHVAKYGVMKPIPKGIIPKMVCMVQKNTIPMVKQGGGSSIRFSWAFIS